MMKDVVMGLPQEALKYLTDNLVRAGCPCTKCGQRIPQNPIIYKQVAGSDSAICLYRFFLKDPGVVAEEYLQISIGKDDKLQHYIGLSVKPDNILTFGNGRTIEWDLDLITKIFK